MKLRSLLYLAALPCLSAPVAPHCGGEPLPQVCILKIVDHRALDETVAGIREALRDRKLKIRVESAQGNPSLALQIGQKFAARNPSVVVGVGTVAAQGLLKYAQRSHDPIPLVYSSITDPASAGLLNVASVTGVCNFVPLRPQLELFRRIQPHLSALGVPYNPGEANSVAILDALRPICAEMGIALVARAATRTADMPQVAAELARRVDALFVSNDNTALAALGSIIAVADVQGIPVYVSDTDAVELGALAALGPNQRAIGRQTGRLIGKILDDEAVGNLPPEGVERTDLIINAAAAERLGLAIGEDLLREAAEVLR
jgi:putative ABC transport system substrate-binding protein